MIKLSNAILVANTSDELVTLQGLLATLYPEFLCTITDNNGEEKDNFPFKMLVDLDTSIPDVALPSMPDFFKVLLSKIDQLNQPT